MIAGCLEIGAEILPALVAGATPSGTIDTETYTDFKREILVFLRSAGAIDAVALDLHGAGVVDGIDDLEGDLAAAIRKTVGPRVKLVAAFDLHGNVTQFMADALDLMFGCHEYPHVDMFERGLEGVLLIPKLISGEIKPVTWIETVPVLLPTSTTFEGPAREVKEFCLNLEKRKGLIDCTFFHGFPYTDTPLVGVHFSATSDNDRELARRTAQEAARYFWERRENFRPVSLTCEEAIQEALAFEGAPVVINETSDNPGGGTPGDGTHLLRAMVQADLKEACFGFIADPLAVDLAHRAGVGSTIETELGGRYDDLHGAPLPVSAYVKTLSDGRFLWRSMLRGVPANLGKMARLQVGGIDVIVSSNRSQTFDPEPFLEMGIDITRYKIVALKSSQHFRAGFMDLAKKIVTADPPGLTTLHLEIFPRKRKPGALWPIDDNVRYETGKLKG